MPQAAPAPAALLLATHWRLPYRALRCAADCFGAVHVLGTAAARPLRRSRASTSFTELPPGQPGFGPGTVAMVQALCTRLGIGCILPSDGPTTRFLAEHGPALGAAHFPVPALAAFDLLDNKARFIGLCDQLGIPTPATRMVADRPALEALLDSGPRLPIVVKPVGLSGSQGVYVIGPETPRRALGRIDYAPIMVQSFIDGPDYCAFYLCRAGRPLAEIIYRQEPDRLEFVRHPAIRRQAETIIGHLGLDGIIGFDIREGADGTPYFLECNPRCWINMDKAMLAGMNFIALGIGPGAVAEGCIDPAAGRHVLRAAALARNPGSWFSRQPEHAVMAYYRADLPMVIAMARDKLDRELGMASGSALHTRGGAMRLG